MSIIDDLGRKWSEMDDLDRKNFWIAIGFGILIILMLFTLSDTMSTLGGILGSGANAVNGSMGDISKLANKPI
jgi:hypothetical protein